VPGSKPIVTYFDVRGRVEVIRLIFEELGIEYEEHQVVGDQWQALKPKTPFGGLPIYEEGDLCLVHSRAIFRHLARKHGLYGREEGDRVQCDMVAEAIDNAERSLWGWLRDPEPRTAAHLASTRYLPDFGNGPRGRIRDPGFVPRSG